MQYRKNTYAEGVYDTYWFEKNLQGDIVAVYDDLGDKLVSYTYDAWGNCAVTYYDDADEPSPARYNPFRYRGYYFDTETGFYYLNSRYYDPVIGRFVNADSVIADVGGDIQGYNIFAYCGNNPVNRVDPTGRSWIDLLVDTFVQTIQQTSGYFAVAAGVSQVDTPAPGPADAAAAFLLLGGILYCAGKATYTTITADASTSNKAQSKTYSVYFLKDSSGTIQYVGRVTDSGYSARMRHHYLTKGYTPKYRIPNLSYAQARGLEEIGMIMCHTLNNSNPKGNRIHGISLTNEMRGFYTDAAMDYLINHVEEWLLNLFD